MKCNCLCWTIHIEGAPLLPSATSTHDFVLSLSYGVWPDELANPLCIMPLSRHRFLEKAAASGIAASLSPDIPSSC